MEWTQEQRAVIYGNYWAQEESHCPDDNAVLDVKFQYEGLLATCPRCRKTIHMNMNEDPKKDTFRQWTAVEINEMGDAHFQNKSSSCPVCQRCVDIDATSFSGMTVLNLSCQRCGNKHEIKSK